ncbi:MAG: T9SS type A sorting domain-containing protein [Flavobacterium sp.]|nr:MAG: T9SS type A sorting domain-containing protein [Flavobacterium sp.]
MKSKLQLAFSGFLFSLLLSGSAFAQITYTEDFEATDHGWSEGVEQFAVTNEEVCDGIGSFRANVYNVFDVFVNDAETISSSIGTSDGTQQVLTYKFKVLDYFEEGDAPTIAANWGSMTVEYGPSATGPWTLIETVTPANHEASLECVIRTSTFTPAAGPVYLRYNALSSSETDVFFYLDDIIVTQSVACSGTPATATAVANDTDICQSQEVTLSLNSIYTDAGISIQWQSSADGLTFTDVAQGGEGATYTTTQAGTTFYRAIVTCEASELFSTSTPVEVVSNGEVCYCDITFLLAVEPITLVEFAGITNATSNEPDGTPAYEDFTALEPAMVVLGQTYPITLAGNTVSEGEASYENFFTVFIDFNQNGVFDDEGEVFEIGSVEGSNGEDGIEAEGSITIPLTAATGLARMRVVKQYEEFVEGPCGSEQFGQAEDYMVMIDAVGATGSFDSSSFTYYPNPVKDVLNVSYVSNISAVEVYNIVGQQVMVKTINGNEGQVDMSGLAAGTYMVKVTADSTSKTIKVIKH